MTSTTVVEVRCDVYADCTEPVTHIGDKGYAYCATHGPSRRESGYERVRRMRPWEVRWLRAGRVLPSYKPGPEPKGHPDDATGAAPAEGGVTGPVIEFRASVPLVLRVAEGMVPSPLLPELFRVAVEASLHAGNAGATWAELVLDPDAVEETSA